MSDIVQYQLTDKQIVSMVYDYFGTKNNVEEMAAKYQISVSQLKQIVKHNAYLYTPPRKDINQS